MKEYEKEYICITESLCCTVEINIVNQLYVNKINKLKKSSWEAGWCDWGL